MQCVYLCFNFEMYALKLLVGNRSVGNRECKQTKLLAKCCRQPNLLAIGNVG